MSLDRGYFLIGVLLARKIFVRFYDILLNNPTRIHLDIPISRKVAI